MSEKMYEAMMGLLKLSFLKRHRNHSKSKKNLFQLYVLRSIFEKTSHPSSATQIDLAILLKMPIRSVKIWFQNARQQKKKKMALLGNLNLDDLINDDMNNIPISMIMDIINIVKKNIFCAKK